MTQISTSGFLHGDDPTFRSLMSHSTTLFECSNRSTKHPDIFQIKAFAEQYVLYYDLEHITKTSPCNENALTPHFYIVKLGFTVVYIIFLFLL